MDTLLYRGYIAEITIDVHYRGLVGRVLGIQDGIVFEGDTVEELVRDFRSMVDDYLEWSAEAGREPSPPIAPEALGREYRRDKLFVIDTDVLLEWWKRRDEAHEQGGDDTRDDDGEDGGYRYVVAPPTSRGRSRMVYAEWDKGREMQREIDEILKRYGIRTDEAV